MKNYDHTKIEKKWQKEWDTKKVYKTETITKKKKFYVLDMFPYPSGAGLHVGHPRGYIGSDVYARMKRMQGFNVLHPMGYDAFGLPAEQYAIEHKIHPRKAVDINVATFEKQLSIIGLSYDWSRKVNTTDPAYYKWTQWIFLEIYNSWYDTTKNKARPIAELVKLFEKNGNKGIEAVQDANFTTIFSSEEWGAFSPKEKQEILMKYRLAYEGYALVNWCPKLGTVLANDEIVEGKDGSLVSERGGYPVEKLSMRQWFMRITAYADRLLTDLEGLNWSSHIKEIQKNWIGKSIGSEIEFPIVYTKDTKRKILIGTRNEAKFRMVKECLPDLPNIEFVSLNDIAPIDDSSLIEGMDYVENARMKAEFYYTATGLPTISLDNVLWLEKWKKDNGMMIHMRKEANPKSERATDTEVIVFFQNWLKKVGGKSKAHFVYAVAFTDATGTRNFNSIQREYILQGKQSTNFWPGYPTESLLVDEKTKEYKGDQTNEIRYSTLISELKEYSKKWFIQTPTVKVFTTRADTLFGVTYIVLSPEHTNIGEFAVQAKNTADILTYIREAKERIQKDQINDKEKTGIELKGITATNPANGEQVPVWVADYVLAGYGTGAVMAVPAHDERDYEFAKKYNLPMTCVIKPNSNVAVGNSSTEALTESYQKQVRILAGEDCYTGEGVLVSSNKFTNLRSEEARTAITKAVGGKIVTKFKMRDAIFARQRYWGEPIPLRHDTKDGITTPLKIKELPLKLPNVTSYEPTGTGESPLAGVKSWVKEGYETNTMPGWAGSSWYFLRYMDPKNSKEFASKKALKYWKDVDMYVGGQEHATGHLLYSRFWHKFLFDRGYVPVKEPFKTLKNQGLIIATDGRKMSKRWGNVINPDEIVKTYGADTLRVYEMFMGPFEQTVSWSTESIIGSRRFIERVYRLAEKVVPKYKDKNMIHKTLQKTIKKVTEDIESMSFNTAVSSMMVFLNEMDKLSEISKDDFKQFSQVLAPFAPHVSEELWHLLGEKKSIHKSVWPKWNPKEIIDDTITIVVQVNGKVRTELVIPADMPDREVELRAQEHSVILPWIEGKTIQRIIYVKGRLINIVV